ASQEEVNGDGNDNERKLLPRGEKTAEELAEEELKKKERLRKALEAEDRRAKEYVEKDERKRKYNSRSKDTYEVTEEEMEAYRQKKIRSEDPMRAFLTGK